MKRILAAVSFLLAIVPTTAPAQDSSAVEAPSLYQEEVVDQQGSLSGEEYEADAADAQAAAAESGRPVPGLSRQGTREVEEIVVQARRRDELLEETPVAITALGDSELREHGVNRLVDIQQLVPNISFQGAITGQQTNIRIRGIGTSASSIAFDPGVGMYIDGVYIPRAFGTLIDVVDPQQIEVLRGPQGTLFGKNTVGGAINVRTAKPHEDFEGFVMLEPGNFGSIDTRAMVNLPIVDGLLYSRFAMATVNSRGYFYDEERDEYFNDAQNLSFLGSLRFLPTERLTIDLSGSWSRARNHGLGANCVVVKRDPSLASLLPDGFFESCERSTPFSNQANTSQLADTPSYGVWAVADYQIGDIGFLEDLSLRGLFSWREQHPKMRNDVDGTRFTAIAVSSTGKRSGTPPGDGIAGSQRQLNPELLLNGAALDGRVNYVLGVFGFWEDGYDGLTQTVLVNSLDRLTRGNTSISNWTWAVFGQATADLTDWASLTAGVRYTQDKKGLIFSQTDLNTDTTLGEPLVGDQVFDDWTPMANLALTLPEDLLANVPVEHFMGYFTYSKGFKGGGFNGVPQPQNTVASQFAFGPETLENFEVGFKTMAFDSRFTMNVALFYGDYDDIQQTAIRDLGVDEFGIPIIQRLTINASSATTKGFEIETFTRPIEGLLIQANVGFTDATYGNFPNGLSDMTGEEIDRTGEQLPATPKLQTFIAAQYSFPIQPGGGAWLDGWLTPRIEWAYQSAVNWLGPEVAQARMPGWNAINARLSYDFLDDRAQIALWGKNLLDVEHFSFVTPIVSTFGTAVRYYDPPRTYGGELSYRF